MDKIGVIYILTNPSFPEYVKIGYADDINKRLQQLNRSECIPFAFRVYATYEVNSRLSDLKIHSIIDKLNPNLRSIETFSGQKRIREFYAMSPEDAYSILEAIAEIHGCMEKLKRIAPSAEEKVAEETAENIELEYHRKGNTPITLEEYLRSKNPELVKIYGDLHQNIIDKLEDTEVYVLPQYVGWRKNGKYFAEIHIQQQKISILTLVPEHDYSIGEKVPENFLWTLNYRTHIKAESEIAEVKEIILESYRKR